ncbi:uncharacterized protein EI90DRAFT_3114786 [Cantharellus anzutake]|uniref:uncharacterized protein n=1 Tax=Cantharellus anzutake TaxID=1750568 RepID=UPI0019041E3A|nr:uncharacterized protein EI90DRAFT_3114786 [Cantharellus anzutake]KAF8344095.1 hypothetical protein EI90DRAFT_3114786 [Cantharellus anzutake]
MLLRQTRTRIGAQCQPNSQLSLAKLHKPIAVRFASLFGVNDIGVSSGTLVFDLGIVKTFLLTISSRIYDYSILEASIPAFFLQGGSGKEMATLRIALRHSSPNPEELPLSMILSTIHLRFETDRYIEYKNTEEMN